MLFLKYPLLSPKWGAEQVAAACEVLRVEPGLLTMGIFTPFSAPCMVLGPGHGFVKEQDRGDCQQETGNSTRLCLGVSIFPTHTSARARGYIYIPLYLSLYVRIQYIPPYLSLYVRIQYICLYLSLYVRTHISRQTRRGIARASLSTHNSAL